MMMWEKEQFIRMRQSAGLNQNQTARMLNVSRELIRQYESGQTVPGCRMLGKICSLFEADPNQFFKTHDRSARRGAMEA